MCFKHRSFRDEREWRLVTQETVEPQDLTRFGGKNVDVKFRLTPSGRVVPYIEVDYDPLPVREIVLGYSAPQLEADAGLQFLIARKAPPSATIRRSTVSVRP